jgi:hypothetical protein
MVHRKSLCGTISEREPPLISPWLIFHVFVVSPSQPLNVFPSNKSRKLGWQENVQKQQHAIKKKDA